MLTNARLVYLNVDKYYCVNKKSFFQHDFRRAIAIVGINMDKNEKEVLNNTCSAVILPLSIRKRKMNQNSL